MIITVNAKKTVIITTIGLCFLGSLYAAYRLYVRKKKAAVHRKTATGKSNHHKTGNGSVASGGGIGGKLERPLSLTTGDLRLRKANVTKSSSLKSSGSQYQTPSSNNIDDEQKNLPAEELLELGLDYLTQAIKSWETALDSIENAAYMQSQVRALPNDQHADLVYKLRNLVDSANNITLNCGPKLVKSSKTLQIIQSRLAHKQHRYAEALIRNSTGNIPAALSEERLENTAARVSSPSGSLNTRYTSADEEEEDNESFVSADSDVDWLTEEMLQNIQNVDDKNVLYEMAVSNVNLGGVSYRVSRAELLKCGSEQDFAAKLQVIRLGFDRLLQDASKRQWFIDYGRNLLDKIMQKAEKDSSGLSRNYDEIIRFVTNESNWRNLKDELATRDVQCLNFYDVALDFILLDAFDDLEDPPSAISAVIQNRWLSQSFKETALATAVWSVLKAKRRLLKYPDGFISRFYSLNEYLVPVLAWGFLGTDPELNRACHFLKNQVVEYLTCLFDMNRTRYTNLEELTIDIDTHSTAYLQNVLDNL